MPNHIIFATSNPHKLEEARAILDQDYIVEGLDSMGFTGEIPETGDTIAANAILKVEYISDYTTHAVFAEDTGLIVPALDGAPGVYSARYAGEHKSDADNIAKLLRELEPKGDDRRAYFQTVLAYRDPKGQILTFSGEAHGQIAQSPRGTKGFGYDPVFIPDGYELTFAELGDQLKNRISHRRKAIDQFTNYLKQKGIR